MSRVTLVLPEPPNMANGNPHWGEVQRYKRRAWAAACSQHLPFADAPKFVRMSFRFRLHQLMDEDGLVARTKPVIDCLKQVQRGRVRWRGNLFIGRGFLWDDPPEHMHIASCEQVVDRSNRGVTVILEWDAAELEEAA